MKNQLKIYKKILSGEAFTDEELSLIEKTISALTEKITKENTRKAETDKEREPLRLEILDVLAGSEKEVTASFIAETISESTSLIVARLRELVNDGRVLVDKTVRPMQYRLPTEDEES